VLGVSCTALLNWKSEFGRGSDSGFSSWPAQPTIIFFIVSVWKFGKLSGTEHSLNRGEHRVLEQSPEVWKLEFQKFRVMS